MAAGQFPKVKTRAAETKVRAVRGYPLIHTSSPINLPGVCRASHVKLRKIACKAIFYPANSTEPKVHGNPDNRDFCVTDGAKIRGCDRLPGRRFP
jgi:hypothetical protein